MPHISPSAAPDGPDSALSPARRRLAELARQIAAVERDRDAAQWQCDRLSPSVETLATLVSRHQDEQKALLEDGVDHIDYVDRLFRVNRLAMALQEQRGEVDFDALRTAQEAVQRCNGQLGSLVAQRDEAVQAVAGEAARAFLERHLAPQVARVVQLRHVVDALGPGYARLAAEAVASVRVEPDLAAGRRFLEELIRDPSAELQVPTEPPRYTLAPVVAVRPVPDGRKHLNLVVPEAEPAPAMQEPILTPAEAPEGADPSSPFLLTSGQRRGPLRR